MAKIQAFSVESGGTFDLDAELELWFSGSGRVKFEFSGKTDVAYLNKLVAHHVLQGLSEVCRASLGLRRLCAGRGTRAAELGPLSWLPYRDGFSHIAEDSEPAVGPTDFPLPVRSPAIPHVAHLRTCGFARRVCRLVLVSGRA